MIDKKKERVQKEALSSLLEKGKLVSGSLFMGTGTGKTKVAIDYIKLLTKELGRVPKTLWLTPTVKLRDIDSPQEFMKWEADEEMENTDFVCYSSAKRIASTYDLAVLDECHNITENNYSFALNSTIDRFVCLSATPPEDPVKLELIESLAPPRYIYTLEEGVEDEIIKPINIYVINVPLDNTEKYIEVKTKNHHFYTTEESNYKYLTKMVNKFKGLYFNKKSKGTENLWRQQLSKRANFLYTLKSKERIAKQILEILPKEEKILTFCKRISMIENLGIPEYHSKTDDKELNKFISGENRRLGVVDALNEGANIPDLRTALIVNLDSRKKNLIQRIGRTVRKQKTQQATIIILITPDTQDQEWFKNSIDAFENPKVMNFHNFEFFKKHFFDEQTNLITEAFR